MDKDNLIAKVEQEAALKKKGIMPLTIDSFLKTVCYEDRLIGFSGIGESLEVESISIENMKKIGLTYKDIMDDFPDISWKRQKVGDDLEISSEQNAEVLFAYEESQTRKSIIENKDKRNSKRSYKS